MRAVLLMLVASSGPVITVPPPADPLTAEIETADADRFAALYERTGGKPTAEQIQREYIDRGSYGVHVFTPDRIIDAENLATAIAAQPESYSRALQTCLPTIKNTSTELRATYLAFRGLFPDKPLPRIYLVVGAGNSGGTAGPGAQVLGLEVLCRSAETPEALREVVRGFYAHETVHTMQSGDEGENGNHLLSSVLNEGAADFIASLVTGRQMDEHRAGWAAAREPELWHQFEEDLKTTQGVARDDLKRGTPAGDAFFRWIANAGSAPSNWPGEAGYWMGQQIWKRWYDQQPDKQAALHQMLQYRDPEAVLDVGRFRSR